MKFCWVTIMVKNMVDSLHFYQEIIGLKLDRRMKTGPDAEIVFLGDGETKVELIYDKNKQDVELGKDISLGFEVASVEEMMKTLQSKEITIHSGPFQPNPHVKFFFITDPNGLKIQFVENICG